MENKINPLSSLRLLGQACVGVLLGTLIAMLVARIFFPVMHHPNTIPAEMLSWNLHNVLLKPREKSLYLFTILFGFIGAWFTTRRLWNISSVFLYLVLILSIPLFNFLAQQMIQHNHLLWIGFLTCSMFLGLVIFAHQKALPVDFTLQSDCNYSFQLKYYLPLLLIITLLLLPVSFTELAAHIGMEMHVVSFIIGPALYFLNPHLLPGIDYFTQYSLGMGWLFAHILGTSAETAILHYAYFVIIAIWFFYAQLLLLLAWLYRSWRPAALITLLSLILLFHTKVHFFDPSSSVLRYPLLGMTAFILAIWIKQPRSLFIFFTLASTLALSVFLNTETGIIIGLAVVSSTLLSSSSLRAMLLPTVSVVITSILIFFLLLLSIFGFKILQTNFFLYLTEPLLIYGKIGFGGWPIAWTLNDLNWFYNLVTPAIAIATLGLVSHAAKNRMADRPRLAVISFFSITGLLMMVKYINMAIVAVWQMNALGFLVVLGWWAQVVTTHHQQKEVKHDRPLFPLTGYNLATFVFIVGALYLAACSSDSRNPSQYGLRSWIHYPSLVRSFIHKSKGCNRFDCVPHRPHEKDVALITSRTQSGEPVAIIDLYDWTYLISAQRPPLMFFLPSSVTFMQRQFIESLQRLKTSRYLFLPIGENNEPLLGHVFQQALSSTFHQHYVLDGVGEKLCAWRRVKE